MVLEINLENACIDYEKSEKRGTFYDMAKNLIEKGFEVEAFFLILATWNFATFRYAVKEFDINGFINLIKNECDPIFNKLKNKNIENVNLDEIEDDIKELYIKLSSIKGVKYTGASKLMHLKNRHLFIMWDGFIRKQYGFNKGTPDDYFNFLKKMQEMTKNVKWINDNKTLAKAIDEYNYMTITFPELEKKPKKVIL